MKFDKDTATRWRFNTLASIKRLNEVVGNSFTGEGFYNLEFRGKNHRPILTLDGMIIASGIVRINDVLYDTLKYYHII